MFAQAVLPSYQDTAATFMRPLREASELLAESSRAQKTHRTKYKAKQPAYNPAQRQRLVDSFANSMKALESAEASSLYCTQEELQKRLQDLTIALNMAATVKNLGEVLVTKAKFQGNHNKSLLIEVHGLFSRFCNKLKEVVEFVEHLTKSPEPDEESEDFANFLISLNKAVA